MTGEDAIADCQRAFARMALDDGQSQALRDAELAEMRADLGDERRDEVSAPWADNRGRAIVADYERESAILANDETRRRRLQQSGNAWYNTSNFSNELSADSAMNGQSHRSSLRAGKREYDPVREHLENKISTERLLHRERRAASASTHTIKPHQVLHTRLPPPSPPPPSRISPHHPSGRGSTHRAPTSRVRAPSPRAAGTTRFLRCQRVSETSARGNNTTTLTPKVAKRIIVPKTCLVTKSSKEMDTMQSAPMEPRPANTMQSHSTIETRYTLAQLRMLAKSYASEPRSVVDEWLAKNPSQAARYWIARKALVDETIGFISSPNSDDAKNYYQTHPARKWLLDEAIKLKELLEDDIREFREYTKDHHDPDIVEAVEQHCQASRGASEQAAAKHCVSNGLTKTDKQDHKHPSAESSTVQEQVAAKNCMPNGLAKTASQSKIDTSEQLFTVQELTTASGRMLNGSDKTDEQSKDDTSAIVSTAPEKLTAEDRMSNGDGVLAKPAYQPTSDTAVAQGNLIVTLAGVDRTIRAVKQITVMPPIQGKLKITSCFADQNLQAFMQEIEQWTKTLPFSRVPVQEPMLGQVELQQDALWEQK